MSSNYYDAVVVIPKRSVMFRGFAILAHYNGKDCTYKFKYKIDEELSEELVINC
jgi:hypothetical protein